jgi:hypothetical protein
MKFLGLILILISINAMALDKTINAEFGLLQVPYNRAAIPGDKGTAIDLSKSTEETYFYHRLQYRQMVSKNQGFRILYAPLTLKGDEVYNKDISFNGENFAAGNKIQTNFKFNSYRASYFWRFTPSDWVLDLGVTIKIRDAYIKLKQGSLSKERKDLGMVPLLYFWAEKKFCESWVFNFDFDGFAAPQGRAFDIAASLGYEWSHSFRTSLGVRMLEGGADNDKVYTFSRFHYGFVALQYNF